MTKTRRMLASAALLSLLGVASFAQAVNPVSGSVAYGEPSESLNAVDSAGNRANSTLFATRVGTDRAGIDVTWANRGYYSEVVVGCPGNNVFQQKWAVGAGTPYQDNIVYCNNVNGVLGYLEVFNSDP
jgi:hypothetical protein